MPAMVAMAQNSFQHLDFLRAELDLLALLDYRLEVVTPYDYAFLFGPVLRKYLNMKALEKKIGSMVDFAIFLPYLALVSPLFLYLACLLEVLGGRLAREELERIERFIDEEEVSRIRGCLKAAMEKVLREGRLEECDFNGFKM